MYHVKALFICFFLCVTSTVYATPLMQNLTVEMRDSGYTLGDKMQMTVTFNLPPNMEIDEESLPLTGRFNHWLDVHHIALQQNNGHVTLDVVWQLFATVEIAQQLTTPTLVLRTIGQHPQKVIVPKQSFHYSPVLPIPPLKNINRRTDKAPLNFDTKMPLIYVSFCLSLCAFLILAWLWLQDALPWLPYRAGPMTRLYRQLKKAPVDGANGFTQMQLRDIHAALNQSAGVSLYPENLASLFEKAPYFASEREQVTTFFHWSWSRFYQAGVEQAFNQEEVLPWVQRTAIAERLFRRKNR